MGGTWTVHGSATVTTGERTKCHNVVLYPPSVHPGVLEDEFLPGFSIMVYRCVWGVSLCLGCVVVFGLECRAYWDVWGVKVCTSLGVCFRVK